MGDVKQKGRFEFLQRFLGKEGAAQLDTELASIQAILDGAGIARKEFDPKKVKGLLETLQSDFMKPLAKLTDDEELKAELANKFIAMAMGAFANMGEEMPEAEAVPEEELILDETMAEEEEEEEEEEEALMFGKAIMDLAQESTQVNKELQQLIPAFIDMAKTVSKLSPLVEKAQQVEGLEARIKELESIVSLTPRSASKSDETVVVSPGLQTILEKSTKAPNNTIWGHEVKPEVN